MDTAQDVGEIGLRGELVKLCSFNDCHGAGEGFGTGISPREEPILPSYSNRAQCALGRVIVDGHTPIGQEQAEGFLPTEAIAEGLGQVAFARNAQKLPF